MGASSQSRSAMPRIGIALVTPLRRSIACCCRSAPLWCERGLGSYTGGTLIRPGSLSRYSVISAQAYAVQGPQPPFIHVVPEPVLRRANFEDLGAVLREARGTVETKVAWADGRLSKLIPEDNPEGDEPTDSDGSVRPKLIPIRVVDEGSNTSQIVADFRRNTAKLVRARASEPSRRVLTSPTHNDAHFCGTSCDGRSNGT